MDVPVFFWHINQVDLQFPVFNDVDLTLRQRRVSSGKRGQGYNTITKKSYDKQSRNQHNKDASIEYKKVFLFKFAEAGEADEIYMHSST